MHTLFAIPIEAQKERRRLLSAEISALNEKIKEATGPYTVGTSYFEFEFYAEWYYAKQGLSKAAVAEKIKMGEIHIGRPPYTVDLVKIEKDSDGRFEVTYDPARTLTSNRNAVHHELCDGVAYERFLERMDRVEMRLTIHNVNTKTNLEAAVAEAVSSKWPNELPYNGYGPYCSVDECRKEEDKQTNNRLTSFDFKGDRYDIDTIRICSSSSIATHYGMEGRTASLLFKNGEFLSVVKSKAQALRLIGDPQKKDIIPHSHI